MLNSGQIVVKLGLLDLEITLIRLWIFFWSFWFILQFVQYQNSSISHAISLHIIFLVCHLSISLPRGQDDYIIELKFLSIWISLLGASHHSGHLIPLLLASLLSILSYHLLITSNNNLYQSLMDRYWDSLNPDSWGSSLVLGMILRLMIRILLSHQFRYLGVLSGSLKVKLRSGDNLLNAFKSGI